MTTKKPRKRAPQNRGKSGARPKPPPGRRFKPGQSGNPGGRPAIPEDVKEAFREATPEALATLLDVCRNGGNDSARVSAANSILDRGLGKAPQAVELTGKDGQPLQLQAGPLKDFTDAQLIEIERTAQAALEAAGRDVEGAGGAGVAEAAPVPAPAPDPAPAEVSRPDVS